MFIMILLYRIFHNALWFDSTSDEKPIMEIRVMTFKDSPRGSSVETWLRNTGFPFPVIDMNNTEPHKDYTEELKCSRACDCQDMTSLGAAYAYRIKRLFSMYKSNADWLLLLEDDAHPFSFFENKIRILLPTLNNYDYVSLDVRSFAGIGQFWFHSMCCTTGVLVKISSLNHIAEQIAVTPENGCLTRWDVLIGKACSTKRLNCLALPYLGENQSKSTL
jgi:hypothetical protein